MNTQITKHGDLFDSRGFTLIELVAVIVLLGIIAAVAIPRFSEITESAKQTATQEELNRLKTAIIGDARVVAGGAYVNKGFIGDVGFAPSSLQDLAVKPDSVPVYNKFTGIGWNGPYVDSSGGDYLTDSWNTTYSYNSSARTIISTGSGSNISVSF